MWTYHIATGQIFKNGQLQEGQCYSGHGSCKNDPTKTSIVMEGPIPLGKYKIGNAYKHDVLGPVTMNLEILPGTNTFGRSLFRIHGDSAAHPGDASHGCIVAPRQLREAINFSQDKVLEVVA